jgi:hypothetical protein
LGILGSGEDGVFLSMNNGTNWTVVNAGLTNYMRSPGRTDGFGVNMENANGLSRQAYFAQEREDLKGQLDNFELCLRWLDENSHLDGKWNAHYWKDRVQGLEDGRKY